MLVLLRDKSLVNLLNEGFLVTCSPEQQRERVLIPTRVSEMLGVESPIASHGSNVEPPDPGLHRRGPGQHDDV